MSENGSGTMSRKQRDILSVFLDLFQIKKQASQVIVLGALVLLCLTVFIKVYKERRYYQASSTKQMAQLLKKISESSNPKSYYFVDANKWVEHLRKKKKSKDLYANLQLKRAIARALLYAGRTEESIREWLEIKKQLENNEKLKTGFFIRRFLKSVLSYLSVSYLRLGEQENCIMYHNPDSCLLPIAKSGVHNIKKGSQRAISEYTDFLNKYPRDLEARWLLNIAYMTLGEYPDNVPSDFLIPPKVFQSDYNIKRFRDVAQDAGLSTVGLAGGSIMEDFDNDGYLDIMASSTGIKDQLRFFRNNGDGTFTERTKQSGLMGLVGGLNLIHADYNNNGYKDVLVLRGAWMQSDGNYPNSLLRNNGDGTFDDVTVEAGLLSFHPTQVAAWGDYDNDGWIDLFIGNESDRENSHPSELYHNNADGTFTNVAAMTGTDIKAYIKGATWGDINNDGLIDLYISVLDGPNYLFLNKGMDATGIWVFIDVTDDAGVEEPTGSFPVWFWDYNNDGWLDIFVSGYRYTGVKDVVSDYLGLQSRAERSRLYLNNRDGTFKDMTKEANLDKVLLSMGANFGDLDNDGYLDFYAGTGDPDYRMLIPNRMFRNHGGKYFQDVTTSGGFGHLQKGHGISFGDIDNDGDQDIFIVVGGWFTGDIFQNALFQNPGFDNHWITLSLEGVRSNRSAIGSRIRVVVNTKAGKRDIYATVSTGGSFGSSSLQQEIGLGEATSIDFIEITWSATNRVQRFNGLKMDGVYKIVEGMEDVVSLEQKSFSFKSSVPSRLKGQNSHKHHIHNH